MARHFPAIAATIVVAGGLLSGCNGPLDASSLGATSGTSPGGVQTLPLLNAFQTLAEGQQTFRADTFGSEAFWGDQLHLHQAILGAAQGGVGPGVGPAAALSLGLKVDVDALPPKLVRELKAGKVDLNSPATTVALLKLNAVVGVKGVFEGDQMRSMGITCALCHSTVDNSLTTGVGHRLDGWPNRDLNVGAIVAASPSLKPFTDLFGLPDDTVRAILNSWGPGKFDAHLNLDGKAFRPDGKTAAVVIPAAFGLEGVNLATYEGWGSVPYWNAYVANNEMHGLGTFTDARLTDAAQFPLAVKAGLASVRHTPDLISAKLDALQAYQLSLKVPTPPAGAYDAAAAARGKALFSGKAQCATCHVPPLYTDPGFNLHTAEEIGIDDFQANRAPTHRYRTTPLAGLFTKAKGGYYHDGRFADLGAVVDHYDAFMHLGLSAGDRADLVQFLKSL